MKNLTKKINHYNGYLKFRYSKVFKFRYILLADAKKIFSFKISEENLKELNLISKLYLNEKLEKEYKLE